MLEKLKRREMVFQAIDISVTQWKDKRMSVISNAYVADLVEVVTTMEQQS